MEQAIISGVAHDPSEAKITVVGVPDRVGEAAMIFTAVAEADINIDMIVQNVSAVATGLTDISFTLPRDDGQRAMSTLKRLQDAIRALAEAGVNIGMISTSEIRISVVVDQADLDTAINATHKAFELDADQVEAVVYGGTGR